MRMEELQMLAPTTFPQTSQINLSLVAAKASSTSEKRKDHCKKQMIGREKRKDQVQMVLHSRKASQKDLPSILLWLKLHQMVHVIIIVIIFTIIINLIAVIIIITRPKPAYGRQGLAGLWGQDTDEVSNFLRRSAKI